jgi:hypothetical protein
MSRASPLAREAILSAGAAAALAAVLAWVGPPGTDLAAHMYQRAVFLDDGFTLWNNFWYAGRYSFVTYSLLYYPLAAALGIRLLAVATVSTATLAFAVLVWREWGPRARWSSRTFAIVWAGIVLSAAFPFALGAALALLALWALQARKPWRFAGLAALTAAASPIAFLLLVLVVVGVALGRRPQRWLQAAAGAGLLVVILLEALLLRVFPASGRYPFSVAELAAACVYCVLSTGFTWRVERARTLRWVFPVYGIACLAFFFVSSGVGENVARLRYTAIPITVLVLSLRDWRPLVPALIVLGLAISWNVTPLATSYVRAAEDPAANAAYWQPAVSYLRNHLSPSYRVEAVDTSGHWAALYLPRAGIPLARGWFRQDDFPQNELLYDKLGPKSYVAWLRSMGVRYVLLTRARPDYSARAEAALVAGPRSPLSPVFRTSDLTVYAVPSPAPIVTGPAPARLLELAESRIVARVSAAGSYRVAIRFSRYWQPSTGCLERARDGMIRLVVRRPGVVRLKFSPTPRRALAALAGRPARSCGR